MRIIAPEIQVRHCKSKYDHICRLWQCASQILLENLLQALLSIELDLRQIREHDFLANKLRNFIRLRLVMVFGLSLLKL